MRRSFIAPGVCAFVLLFASCIAHEKNGDSAAAVGDWRSAYYEYGKALEGDPASAPLKTKYDRARGEAIAQASQKAQACAVAGDWGCALEHADFALSLDGGNAEMAVLRAKAGKSVALGWLQGARTEAAQGSFPKAFELLGRAVSASNDPDVAAQSQSTKQEVLARLDSEVDRLRSQGAFGQAIPLLELAVRADPAHQARLETVRQEHAAQLEAQYEERARAGDAAMAQRRWVDAAAQYRAALDVHPGGRAEPLFQYTSGVAQGEQALARQDFPSATDGFRRAAASGVDRDGYATGMLQRVEIRPYEIRLRSVLVYAFRPGGLPWAGRRDPSFDALARALAYSATPRGGGNPETAIAQARMIPPEFSPTLQVEAFVPDRGQLVTAPLRGLYVPFEASFVVLTNSFDTRPLQLHVHHVGPRPEEAGAFSIPLKDVIASGRLLSSDHAVAQIELLSRPAPGAPPDAVTGWSHAPLAIADAGGPPPPGNPGAPPPPSGYPGAPPPGPGGPGAPPPGHGWGRFRLAEISVRLSPDDRRRGRGAPATASGPAVEVEQGRDSIFRAQAERGLEATWTPAGAHLRPNERLRVKVWDNGPTGSDAPVLDFWVDPRAMTRGTFETETPRGSWVRLVFGGRR